jgi:hypothetical protein
MVGKVTCITLSLLLLLLCAGCGAAFSDAPAPSSSGSGESDSGESAPGGTSVGTAVSDEGSVGAGGATYVMFDGASVSIDGAGADVSGGSAADGGAVVTVSQAGEYVFSGQSDDGQILVYAGKDDAVRLVLDGLSLKNPEGAVIHVMQAGNAVVALADDSANALTDGHTYAALDEKGEPDAALFSKSDLTIAGGGSLAVTASYADGIVSKDVLYVTGGAVTVDAADDGLRGTDGLVIAGGNLTVRSGGDAIKSTKDEDDKKGYVHITGGTVTVPQCYEGIEAPSIQIGDGEIKVNASDDGINGTTNTDTDTGDDEGGWGRSGGAADYVYVRITGGTLDITGANDGIDVNGALYIDGGDLTVAGPSRGMDGAIDLDGKLTVTGGTLHVTGSVSAQGGVEGWDVPEENQATGGGGFRGGMRQDGGGGRGGPGGGGPMQGGAA